MPVYLHLVFNCHCVERSSTAIKLHLITKTVEKCVVLLLPGQLIPIRNFAYCFINAIRIANNFWINELSAFYYFVLFVYFINYFFPIARTVTLWGARIFSTLDSKAVKSANSTKRDLGTALPLYCRVPKVTKVLESHYVRLKLSSKFLKNCFIS